MVPSGEKSIWSTATNSWLRFSDNRHFAHIVETSSGEREKGEGGGEGGESGGKKERGGRWREGVWRLERGGRRIGR